MSHDSSQGEPERIVGYVWRSEPLSLRLTQSSERIVPNMPRQGGWNREALECDAQREECDGVTVWLEDRPLLTQVLHEEVAAALIEAWVLDEAVQVTMLSEIVPMGERILLEVKGAAPAGSERAFRALLELASRTDLPAPGARLIPAWGREPLLHLGHTWRECTAVWGSLTPGDSDEMLDTLKDISMVAFLDVLWGDPAQEVERFLAEIPGIGGLAPGR